MKIIIERQATFENNSDMEVKRKTDKIITSIFKGNTMKQDCTGCQFGIVSSSSCALSCTPYTSADVLRTWQTVSDPQSAVQLDPVCGVDVERYYTAQIKIC